MRRECAACLVALVVAVAILVAGCAGGVAGDSGKVLRNVSLEISGMPGGGSAASEVTSSAAGVAYDSPWARYLVGFPSVPANQWDPSLAPLTGISHQVYTNKVAQLSVFVGNDAYARYTVTPEGGGSYEGVAHHVFIRNETGATMIAPWLELREILGNWTWDPDLTTDARAPSPDTGLRTMASWGDGFSLPNNTGGPGGYTASAGAYYTGGYDKASYQTLDPNERLMHFRRTGTGDWGADLSVFVARLSLWWYEQS